MKKFGLLILAFATFAAAQQPAPAASAPKEQKQSLNIGNTPTPADMYCSGFISNHQPMDRFVAGGWNTPDQTRFAGESDIIYIHGKNMKEGERYQVLRRVRDPNHYELFRGQRWAINGAGVPYFELGFVHIIEVQHETAVAKTELACADIVPGDIVVPFEERETPRFRSVALNRFAPPNGKPQGRILMANEFDSFIGTKQKVYLSIGADRGLKVGDYLRATRTYSYTYHDPEAGMSLKASMREDTQKDPAKVSSGDIAAFPRRTLGDMIVLNVHQKSATAMILTALEDIHVGDGVEVMDVSDAPELKPVLPESATNPAAAAENTAMNPPKISCVASPATVRVGETAGISCDASSPDSRPISIAFVANGGKLSANRNQATLDTADTGPGPIAVRATVFDDRQLSATAVTTVNVEAAALPAATPQKLTDLQFKPNSAYVDNRSKAVLDDVALKMQQDPNSTVILSGSTTDPEPPRLAAQRAENAKTYLTKSRGIDDQRIKTQSGAGVGRVVSITAVPAGAGAPTQEPPKQEPPKQ